MNGEDEVMERAEAVLAGWAAPTPATALRYRTLAEAVTGVPYPLPMAPDEAERLVALARRNREYSAAHTDAMLPHDPPLLPGLLAGAGELDARERAALADRVEEWRRRELVGAAAAEARDLRLAATLRALVRRLSPAPGAALCLLHSLDGRRSMRPDEAAAALGADAASLRRHAADGLDALRDPGSLAAIRDTLEA